jgi:hypothetical protein
MNNQPSPIETLRQLREMLDAGTITASEFEALKQQLIFSAQAPATEPPIPDFTAPAVALPAPAEQQSPMFEDAQLPPDSIDLDANEAVGSPAPRPLAATPADADEADIAETPPTARNPLNLVLAIGGLLVLLAVFAYLGLNRRDSEHISSNSMTAADSLSVVEEGPQAEPIEQPVAVPETVRVAPINPAPPVVKPDIAPVVTDSASALAADTTKKP